MSSRKAATVLIWALVLYALGAVPEGHAQAVRFRSRGEGLPSADQAVRRVIERGRYVVVARDTVLAAGEVIAGDVVVIRSTLRVEGHIEGDLVAVQSDVFTRPGGRIDGNVVVLGGGFYGSALARLRAPPIDASRYRYEAEVRGDGSVVIVGPRARARFRLTGWHGLMVPQYDRVNALTLGVGVEFERGASSWLPEARARFRYRSARSDGDGDLEVRWPFRRHYVLLRGGLSVRTNDGWLNTDLENSIYSLVAATDTRDYYEATFAEAGVRLEFGIRLRSWVQVLASWERARSLANRDPFSLFSVRGGFQANPEVNEADAASVKLGFGSQVWLGERASLEGELGLERAERDLAGDLSFSALSAAGRFEAPLGRRRRLLVETRVQLPGSEGAPPQRWRALGGWGSLPTLRPGERRGDVMWWWAASYRVSLRPDAGLLTRVLVWFEYAAGNAWVDGRARPPTVHNVAVGSVLGPLSLGVYTDPSDGFRTAFAMGLDTGR